MRLLNLQVFLDVGLCQQNAQNRTLGDNAFCKQPEQLGRIVLGNAPALSYSQPNLFLSQAHWQYKL